MTQADMIPQETPATDNASGHDITYAMDTLDAADRTTHTLTLIEGTQLVGRTNMEIKGSGAKAISRNHMVVEVRHITEPRTAMPTAGFS